jgi:hypothetical protein
MVRLRSEGSMVKESDGVTVDARSSRNAAPISRRTFLETAALAGSGLTAFGVSMQSFGKSQRQSATSATNPRSNGDYPMNSAPDEITKEKIRRALLAGPPSVTREATVAEMDAQGRMAVLRPGTNHWVCVPGNQNIIGEADMCCDPMGMQWMMDVIARKPKPTNTTPGLIYMLNGAAQRSYTDPFDRTSPAIPIGPHWMIMWAV